jgi:nicotinamide-nucleotide amidase
VSRPADLNHALTERALTVAVAESLTGGLVVADLVSVPGASVVVRGGIVAYATDLKHDLLGVDAALLAAGGPIQAAVAEQMAEGVRARLEADVGLATTGVAGPDPQDGHPPGEVWISVASASGIRSMRLELGGDRASIRRETVDAVIELALESFPE